MDTSDFYDTAELALKAIEKSSPIASKGVDFEESIQLRRDSVMALHSFIRAADREREVNETRSNYRAHLKEGEL